jgi:lactate dehydrogenase-like 2-hydroxyacid dehydrogenase
VARVLLTRRLPEAGLAPLVAAGHDLVRRDPDVPMRTEELTDAAPRFDAIVALVSDPITAAVLDEGGRGRLRVVANAGAGFDNIDVAAAAGAGITVCNAPGVLDQTVADLTFFLVLGAARGTSTAEADLRAGRWEGWAIDDRLGMDVHGAVLGLVGYGGIAREVARRAAGFGMEVLHHARTNTGLPGFVASLDELLSLADIVSLHVPLTDETRNLIGAAQLARMKADAVLVNTARGGILDEAALVDALERGHLAGVGIDVYPHEPEVSARLLAAPRTVLLPHIGSATGPARLALVRTAAHAVCEVLAGRLPEIGVVTPGALGAV